VKSRFPGTTRPTTSRVGPSNPRSTAPVSRMTPPAMECPSASTASIRS